VLPCGVEMRRGPLEVLMMMTEEGDYEYRFLVDDEDKDGSDEPPDIAGDALGPEDGEGGC
jgi:hypothetical protein